MKDLLAVYLTMALGLAIISTSAYGQPSLNQSHKFQNIEVLDVAIQRYKKAIESGQLEDGALAKAYNDLGLVYYSSGDIEKAIESFKEAIKVKPDYFDAYYNLGSVYLEKGRYSKAISELELALECNPENTDALYKLTLAYDSMEMEKGFLIRRWEIFIRAARNVSGQESRISFAIERVKELKRNKAKG